MISYNFLGPQADEQIPPLIGPFKGINKEYKGLFPIFYIKCRVLKLRFLAFSRGPGGFRELREAGRNHFHLSWYLSDTVVTSYGQKPSCFFCLPSTVYSHFKALIWHYINQYFDQDFWRTWTRFLAYLDQDFWRTWTRFLDQILTRIYTVYSSTGTEKYSVQFHRDGELIKPTRNLLKTYKTISTLIKPVIFLLTTFRKQSWCWKRLWLWKRL